MGVRSLLEDNTVSPIRNEGGIWSGKAWTFAGFSKAVDATTPNEANGPVATTFSFLVNNGAAGDGVGHIMDALATANNTTVFGGNAIARSASGVTGVKLVGFEIDVEPAAGVTPAAGSGGLFINAFSYAGGVGPAIQTGGLGGGVFTNGIVLGGLKSTAAGLCPNAAAAMDSLINSGTGVFTTGAIILSNTHKLRLSGTASTHGYLYMASGDFIRLVLGSSGFAIRDSTDASSLITFDASGNITPVGAYLKGGVQVVGARDTGWTAMTGTPDEATVYDTASVTLPQLAGRVAALQAALTTHGLIGT